MNTLHYTQDGTNIYRHEILQDIPPTLMQVQQSDALQEETVSVTVGFDAQWTAEMDDDRVEDDQQLPLLCLLTDNVYMIHF